MTEVRFTLLGQDEPLFRDALSKWPALPFMAGVRWETLSGGELENDHRGSPTDSELEVCTAALLSLGWISFLERERPRFLAPQTEVLPLKAPGRGFLGRLGGRGAGPTSLVTTRSALLSPALYSACGQWSQEGQALLLLGEPGASEPAAAFLLALLEGEPLPAPPSGFLAYLSPLADGCGVLVASIEMAAGEAVLEAFAAELARPRGTWLATSRGGPPSPSRS